jgi:hypothetical protein
MFFWEVQMLTNREERLLEHAENLGDVTQIALAVLRRIKKERREKQSSGEIIMICGPMSNGGRSLEANLKRFRGAIEKAREKGFLVFDQLPFQKVLDKICPRGIDENNTRVLGGFYRPLFESRHFERTFFLPGWQYAFGSKWERSLSQQLRIPIEEAPSEWLEGPE